MPAPAIAQPFDQGFMEFSLGDPTAAPGTTAYVPVAIGAVGDANPPQIVSLLTTPNFTLTTYLKAHATPGGIAFLNPAILGVTVEHHIQPVDPAGASLPVPGGAIAAIAPPAGASPAGAGMVLNWYAATTGPIVLGLGTYRILTHVHHPGAWVSAIAAFHDGTYIMVIP